MVYCMDTHARVCIELDLWKCSLSCLFVIFDRRKGIGCFEIFEGLASDCNLIARLRLEQCPTLRFFAQALPRPRNVARWGFGIAACERQHGQHGQDGQHGHAWSIMVCVTSCWKESD